MTSADLEKQRTDFWETYGSGVYGGQPGTPWVATCSAFKLARAALTAARLITLAVIWDALKAACSADIETARLICNAAGVVVTGPDLLVVYDERGALYELPPFVLSPPTNLVRG